MGADRKLSEGSEGGEEQILSAGRKEGCFREHRGSMEIKSRACRARLPELGPESSSK